MVHGVDDDDDDDGLLKSVPDVWQLAIAIGVFVTEDDGLDGPFYYCCRRIVVVMNHPLHFEGRLRNVLATVVRCSKF